MNDERLSTTRFATGIYAALENALKKSPTPLTCVDLLDDPAVHQWTTSSTKLSNCLGYMWRKKLLHRHPAPAAHLSLARFAYSWKGDPVDVEEVLPLPKRFVSETSKEPLSITQVPNGVTIESEHFVITIKLRS
jgi:hypothetical protein